MSLLDFLQWYGVIAACMFLPIYVLRIHILDEPKNIAGDIAVGTLLWPIVLILCFYIIFIAPDYD